MRLQRTFDLKLGDSALKQLVAQRVNNSTDDTLTASASDVRAIPAGANRQIDLGGVTTVRAILVECGAAIRVRFGEADDYIPVAPITSGATGVLYTEVTGVTEVWIENPGDSAVSVYVLLAGV